MMDAWASFLPSLMWCLGDSRGSVLEVGVGNWSTPILRAYCRGAGRFLVSVESDPKWAEMFKGIECGDYDLALPALAKSAWSVVFLDHSPGERRAQHAALFAEAADYVVIHDYMSEQVTAMADHIHKWKYHRVDEENFPPTITLSNTRRL